MLRRGLALALAALAAGFPAAAALAQSAEERPFIQHVQAQILREAEALAPKGFGPSQPAVIEMLRRGDTRRVVLRLEAGTTYAVVAACDQDCRHVQLAIHDPDRELLARSAERSSVVLFSGTPDRAGLYEVEIAIPGCRERNCHTGLAVLQQGPPPPGGVIVSRGMATAREPAVAGAAIGMERRPGVEIQGSNYRAINGTSLSACERVCLSDQRCHAVEYYNDNQSCGLFDSVPPLKRASGVDTSIKRAFTR